MSLPNEPKRPRGGTLGGRARKDRRNQISKNQDRRTKQRMERIVRTTKQSGGGPFDKGDEEVAETILIEKKTTDGKSFSIKIKELEKITREARGAGRYPAFLFGFEGEVEHGCSRDWIAVPLDLFPAGHLIAKKNKTHDQ